MIGALGYLRLALGSPFYYFARNPPLMETIFPSLVPALAVSDTLSLFHKLPPCQGSDNSDRVCLGVGGRLDLTESSLILGKAFLCQRARSCYWPQRSKRERKRKADKRVQAAQRLDCVCVCLCANDKATQVKPRPKRILAAQRGSSQPMKLKERFSIIPVIAQSPQTSL